MKSEKIDYSQVANEDDVIEIEEKIKGVTVLLDGLLFAEVSEAGGHKYKKNSYSALNIILDDALSDLKNLRAKIDYMNEQI